MDTIDNGYTLRGVTGGRTIQILARPDRVEIIIENHEGDKESFGLGGFRLYVDDLNGALRLAEQTHSANSYERDVR